MGQHRTSGGTRGISKGPVIAVGVILVVVLGVFGWFELRNRIADQGIQAAETCVEGEQTLVVTVDPALEPPVEQAATRFDDTRPVIRDRCVTVDVHAADSTAVSRALAGDPAAWDVEALGPRPALWIPASSDQLSELPSGVVNGSPRSMASSPVGLAAPEALVTALSGAGTGWADLPGLQQNPDSLNGLGLPGWGGLRLQLPTESAATATVLGAVVSATSDAPDSPLTAQDVQRGQALSALSSIATTDLGPAVTADPTSEALTRLASNQTPEAAVHAVPSTKQDLTESGLSGFVPSGPGPVFDYPAAVLSGEGVDETASRAAAQFVDFAIQSDNARLFLDAGFDSPVAAPSVQVPLSTQQALVDAVVDPATPRRATVLVDVSGSMETLEGGRTRLQNTSSSLATQFGDVVDITQLGLWEYSAQLDGARAYRTVVPTGPVDDTRRRQLVAGVNAFEPESATSTYQSVLAAYRDAVQNFSPGVPNSLVLITDGPNDDTSISSARFLSDLSALVDPSRPTAIDVVSIGTNSDGSTLQSMSEVTGGSFTTVVTSEGPELSDLLRKLLY